MFGDVRKEYGNFSAIYWYQFWNKDYHSLLRSLSSIHLPEGLYSPQKSA